MPGTNSLLAACVLLSSVLQAFCQQSGDIPERIKEGNAALTAGRLDAALSIFAGLAQEAPDLATAHQGLSIVLLRQGRLEDARRRLLRTIELAPDLRNTSFLLGLANFGLGNPQQAETDFRTELERQPNHANARLYLARCLLLRDQRDLAIEQLNRAAEVAPNDPDVLFLLAENYGESRATFAKRLLAAAPDSYQAHHWLAEDYRHRGDLPKSAAEYREAIGRAPAAAGLHFGLGRVLTEMADYQSAMQALKEELQIHPFSGPAHLLLGSLYLADGAFEQAIAHASQAVKLGHQKAEAHLLMGRAYTGLGNLTRAAEELEQALALRPDLREAHFKLAGVYSRLGKPDQAQQHLQAFRNLDASANDKRR